MNRSAQWRQETGNWVSLLVAALPFGSEQPFLLARRSLVLWMN
jgi:hypothetical protein